MNFPIPNLKEEDKGLDCWQLLLKHYPDEWSLTKKQKGNPENFRAYLSRLVEKAVQDNQYWIWLLPLAFFDCYDITLRIRTKSGSFLVGCDGIPWSIVWRLRRLSEAGFGPFTFIGRTVDEQRKETT